jgi:hypothetical protein
MIREILQVEIIDTETNGFVVADLCEGLKEKNLDDYEKLWKPILEQKNKIARQMYLNGEEYQFAEDGHWDWRQKKEITKSASLSYRYFAIECGGKTQGLMQLDLTMHRCRENVNWNIVYIDYISVAPWNRAELVEQPKYRAVGTILLAQAVGTSIEEGFKGRIGLHSLPGASKWYKKRKMKSFGPDSGAKGLEYFEMNEALASDFLNKLEKN